MKLFKIKYKTISFRNTAIITMSVIILPLFLIVVLFNLYTTKQQMTLLHDSRRSTLSVYQSQYESMAAISENFLSDTVANNRDFASIMYSRTKTEAYVASLALGEQCKILSKAYTCLTGFSTYSQSFDCYRINYSGSYPQPDLAVLRKAVISAAANKDSSSGWQPLSFSDRTVLLYTYVRNHTVFAAIIDPSRQVYTDLNKQEYIFYCLPDGIPFMPKKALSTDLFPLHEEHTSISVQDLNGQRYDLTVLPLSQPDGYIVYATPSVSLWGMLNFTQRVLLASTFGLLIFIPLSWLILRRFMVEPLDTLTQTMHIIQSGDADIRVPQKSQIQEVNKIAETVNTMLDVIRQQKIEFYEQHLETQQAQLQYLQLQIRPHFFLNCLNMIYSMAGEKKHADIQELILNLSTYLRSTFKRGSKLISLEDELYSVNSYIRIQQIGTECPPQLDFDIDADTASVLIPPLSVLTFVENSIKHSALIGSSLEIQIKCRKLSSENGGYLNITVRDNGTGITPDKLDALNSPSEDIYADLHVGISNVKQRLRLLYGDKATLYFRNLTEGACVELFLPVNVENSGGNLL